MSKALPFTIASLSRAIEAVERAGRYVVGVRPDGILLVSQKPFDLGSLAAIPSDAQNDPTSKWRDNGA